MKGCLAGLMVILLAAAMPGKQAAPVKKLLVVTTTLEFRHGSIPTAEKVLAQMAAQSGEFRVEFLEQPPGRPAPLKKEATGGDKKVYAAAEAQWQQTLKAALTKLSPESLKDYDGVVFLSTTGDLPIPDRPGFLDWIKAGHAFIAIHAGADTFHHWPGFHEMLGGEFREHGAQVGVTARNVDPSHPAMAPIGPTWTITQEEIYQFKNYDPAQVHELLVLDRHPNTGVPGHYPLAWCRDYGKGRVFYTAFGHRDDIWDADPALPKRINRVETGKAFQAHLLGGIEWALGLKPGSAAPGNP